MKHRLLRWVYGVVLTLTCVGCNLSGNDSNSPSHYCSFAVACQYDTTCNITLVFDDTPKSTKDIEYLYIRNNRCYIGDGDMGELELIHTTLYRTESVEKHYAAILDLLGDSVQIYDNNQHIATMYGEGERTVVLDSISSIDWNATGSIYDRKNYRYVDYWTKHMPHYLHRNMNTTRYIFEFKTKHIE